MSITILNYHDQAFVDQINAGAAARAEAERAAAEAAKAQAAGSDFSSVLTNATDAYSGSTACSEDLSAIFDEAANTYGVSSTLLKSIARAESNFNTSAVSNAGAVGIMQLMPATAASLGVTDSYDAYQNIMGGANLISQLLARYNGDTSLALAAYNAGSANVDKYGIPPFSETQNYVQKVLSYMGSDTNTVASASTAETSEDVATTVSNFIAANNISQDTVEKLLTLLEVLNA